MLRERLIGSDDDAAAQAAGEGGHLLCGGLEVGDDSLGPSNEGASGIGQRDPAVGPLE